jgi:hypothetical protein
MKCRECKGTGVAEMIGGYPRPCDACHGKGEIKIARGGLAHAKRRVRAIANGRHINTTYRMMPEPALAAFRADLGIILDALEAKT